MAYRVFIVAGDNAVLHSLPVLMETNNEIEITSLESSNEALWELQQGAPDVLVADLDLPGFSGLELADLVPDFAPETRVILCARNPSGDVENQAAQRGLFRLLKGEQPADVIASVVFAAAQQAPAPAARAPEPEPEPAPAPSQPAPTPPRSEPKPAPQRAAPPPTNSSNSSAANNRTPYAVSKAPPPAPIRKAPPKVSARPDLPGRSAAQPGRPAAPAARASAPPPAPAPVEEPQVVEDQAKKKRTSGSLVLTAETIAPIRAKLKDLGMQLGAQATVLTDRWGVPLVEEGRTSLPLPPFLPLLATSFSTMIDYTSQLHTDEGSGLYMHEGNRYDIYIFDVGSQFLLVMIFDKEIAASKLGSVWLYAKRAVRELADELEGT